ncbi:MAG: M50 family metallopeptidase [Flavobacteriales bacterium]|nr:M50 family metallopeptidase [Flavobacteriales bacterium]
MIRFIIFILVFPLGISCSINLFDVLVNIFNNLNTHFFFLIGTSFSLIILLFFKTRFNFFSTFEHELTHNIWAMVFFRKPRGFHVNNDGSGLFEYEAGSRFSNVFILLSPYYFPTACFMWLPFYIVWKEQYYWFYFLMMGIFFGYHVMSTIQETGSYQSDITSNGVFYSYLIFIPLYVIFNGIILAHLDNGFSGVIDFLYVNNNNNFEFIMSFF